MVVELDIEEARRIAIRAQLLGADRPQGLVGLVERLNLLQLDPAAAIAPSADLVAWSRLGNDYHPSQLEAGVRARDLFELDAFIRPMSHLPALLGSLAGWPPHARHREWLRANDGFRRDLLAALRERGESLSRDLPDRELRERGESLSRDLPDRELRAGTAPPPAASRIRSSRVHSSHTHLGSSSGLLGWPNPNVPEQIVNGSQRVMAELKCRRSHNYDGAVGAGG